MRLLIALVFVWVGILASPAMAAGVLNPSTKTVAPNGRAATIRVAIDARSVPGVRKFLFAKNPLFLYPVNPETGEVDGPVDPDVQCELPACDLPVVCFVDRNGHAGRFAQHEDRKGLELKYMWADRVAEVDGRSPLRMLLTSLGVSDFEDEEYGPEESQKRSRNKPKHHEDVLKNYSKAQIREALNMMGWKTVRRQTPQNQKILAEALKKRGFSDDEIKPHLYPNVLAWRFTPSELEGGGIMLIGADVDQKGQDAYRGTITFTDMPFDEWALMLEASDSPAAAKLLREYIQKQREGEVVPDAERYNSDKPKNTLSERDSGFRRDSGEGNPSPRERGDSRDPGVDNAPNSPRGREELPPPTGTDADVPRNTREDLPPPGDRKPLPPENTAPPMGAVPSGTVPQDDSPSRDTNTPSTPPEQVMAPLEIQFLESPGTFTGQEFWITLRGHRDSTYIGEVKAKVVNGVAKLRVVPGLTFTINLPARRLADGRVVTNWSLPLQPSDNAKIPVEFEGKTYNVPGWTIGSEGRTLTMMRKK